ncbi:hypothetical protein ACQ4PT_045109 [Festuca glaucescens]
MEFWGLEVKPGQSVKVSPEDDFFLHLSQGALGEVKKDNKATMFVKVDDQKLSIGTLSNDKFPQIQFDLVFEKEFELSHTSKSSSVFFSGYKVFQPADGDEMDFDDDDESEGIYTVAEKTFANAYFILFFPGKTETKDKEPKHVKIAGSAGAAKPKPDVKAAVGKSKKDDDSDDDESDDDSDDDSEGALIPMDDSDDSSEGDDSSSDDEDESDDEEDEETPKKPESGKKRAAETVLKTPASDKKKAKIATPSGQKTGDKKGASVHVATPHPAKKAARKTPATNEKSPKSAGSVACKSCPKTFNSENALQAHSNAKHKAAAK